MLEIPYRRVYLPWRSLIGNPRCAKCLLSDLGNCKIKRKISSASLQTISNKHSNCTSNNNNSVKVCDTQMIAVQEKEKEVLMKEQEENYHKFRQLLDYEDVRRNFNLWACKIIDHLCNRHQHICNSTHSFARDTAQCCLQSSAGNRFSGGPTKL